MINRQELEIIKEKLGRNKCEPCWIDMFIDGSSITYKLDNERLLEIIQSAEEFGAIDGRRERQEANTTALRKVLTDCGFKVQGMGFGDMLYELRKAMEGGESEAPKQPKVLDADGVEIKPGDELYYNDKNPIVKGKFAGIVKSAHADNCPNPLKKNSPWVRYKEDGWDLADYLTHQKPETLHDLMADLDKDCDEYWGCIGNRCSECPVKIDGKTPVDYYDTGGNCRLAMHKDIERRLKTIAKRMGGE